jgi:sterol desaturase/sphingolipid hydroxylase (fatty acid hydroxylase superfamily)
MTTTHAEVNSRAPFPYVALLFGAVGGAVVVWLGIQACGGEGGCYDGARELWRAFLPPSVRSHLRMVPVVMAAPGFYIPLLLALFAQHRWPARPDQPLFGPGFRANFVGWFLFDKIGFGFIFAMLFGYSLVHEWWTANLAWLSPGLDRFLPQWGLLLVSFVFADFLNWLHHLIRHKVPLFWMFHAVHHGDREMNMFTDDRVHPVEKLISGAIMLFPQLILGVDVAWTIPMFVFQQTYTHVYHANIRTDYGPLRYLFVTPQSHRVHHSMEPEHADRNFGVILSVWDRLFGTHCSADGQYPQTGVEDPRLPNAARGDLITIARTYVGQFVYPFRQIWWRLSLGTWYPAATKE